MTSLIGALRVTLGLDTAAFEKGATRAALRSKQLGDEAEHLGQRVGKMGKALMVAGTAFLGLGLVQELGRLVKSGLDYASSLGEQAQQLGVTTKALQEYRYVATQTGVSQEQMDNALAKLTRTMGEAANGTKKSAEAFAALGIDIKAFVASGRDAGELIPLIAQGMSGVGTEAEKARLAVALFGKGGQALMPLLNEGAGGVNNLRDAARSLGIVLSDKQIQSADETADKLAQLQTVLKAQIAGAVADNASSILELVNALTKLIVKAGEAARAWNEFKKSQWGNYLLGGADAPLPDSVNVRRMFTVRSGTPAARAPLDPRGRVGPSFGSGGARPARPAPSSPYRRGMGPRVNRLADAGLVDPGRSFRDFAGGGTIAPQMGVLIEALNKQTGLPQQFKQLEDQASKSLQVIIERVAELSDSTRGMGNTTKEVAAEMRRSFADAAQGILGSLQGLESSLRGGGFLGILASLLDLGLTLGGSGLFGQRAQANVLGARYIPKNAGGKIPGYAGGTSWHPGGLAMVGERGPELVNLPRGAQVYPNGTGPGGGMQVTVTPSKYFDVAVDQRVARAAPSIARAGGEAGIKRLQYRGTRKIGR